MPEPTKPTEFKPRTSQCIDILFAPADRKRAGELLFGIPAREYERCCLAALKISDGDLAKLERAVALGRKDYRDLLMAAGFGTSLSAHLEWKPKPAAEPSEIELDRLAEGIHVRIDSLVAPMGLVRNGDEWHRSVEVTQRLLLVKGLTSRVETRFFLRLTLEAKPLGVILQLPKLPKGLGKLTAEQGYCFRSGDSEDTLFAAVAEDLSRFVEPWFRRFTTYEEVERGFTDRTFHPHLKMKDQALALVF